MRFFHFLVLSLGIPLSITLIESSSDQKVLSLVIEKVCIRLYSDNCNKIKELK